MHSFVLMKCVCVGGGGSSRHSHLWGQGTLVKIMDNHLQSKKGVGQRGCHSPALLGTQTSGLSLAQAKPFSLQLPTGVLLGQEGGLGWTDLSLSDSCSTQNLLASATGQPVSSSGSLQRAEITG